VDIPSSEMSAGFAHDEKTLRVGFGIVSPEAIDSDINRVLRDGSVSRWRHQKDRTLRGEANVDDLLGVDVGGPERRVDLQTVGKKDGKLGILRKAELGRSIDEILITKTGISSAKNIGGSSMGYIPHKQQ